MAAALRDLNVIVSPCHTHHVDTPPSAKFLRQCSLAEGRRIHASILRTGTAPDTFLGNVIVDMYFRCGSIEDAQNVFSSLHRHNGISWNIMISAFVRFSMYARALNLYHQMRNAGILASKITFISTLRACSELLWISEGQIVHAHILQIGMEWEVMVGNCLISMYGKFGLFKDAARVFGNMPKRSVVTWTAMISVHAKHGHGDMALQLFRNMQLDRLIPDKTTYICVLEACSIMGNLEEGRQIHNLIDISGYASDYFVQTAIINMYGKCGSLERAFKMFFSLPQHNVVSWNAIITACTHNGRGWEALDLFKQMQNKGIVPSKVTFIALVDACANVGALKEGELIHHQIVNATLESDMVVANALINMYGKCCRVDHARRAFDRIPEPNVVSWTSMISAYAWNEQAREAIILFRQMQQVRITPNRATFISLLDACGSFEFLGDGKWIHASLIDSSLESEVAIANALISMYGRCTSIEYAKRVFHKMSSPNRVSWNALIAASLQNGQNIGALDIFEQMHQRMVSPNKITFICILDACSRLASLEYGKQIHAKISDYGLETDIVVANALVNMYARCGQLEDANHVFQKMQWRDVSSWNTLITAYAQHGQGQGALSLFVQMVKESVKPNDFSFISIFAACSYAGLLSQGYHNFLSMHSDYGTKPLVEHYGSLVDMFGRMGHLEEANDLICHMPCQPTFRLWTSLLSSCKKYDVWRGSIATYYDFSRLTFEPG